jgi:hypothetical protein
LRTAVTVLTVLLVSLFAAGCGGSKDISEVSSCLKDAKLDVENAKKIDEKVKEGVFATSDLKKGDAKDITIAVAAIVKSDDTIKDFEKQNKDFVDQLAKSDSGKGLKVESGTDDRYVWVVMGNPDKDGFKKAKDCVEA